MLSWVLIGVGLAEGASVNRDFFGVNSWYTYGTYNSLDARYAEAESAGCSWIRELLRWDLVQRKLNTMSWTRFDSAVAKQARHGLQTLTALGFCPDWASSHYDAVKVNGVQTETIWSPFCPPRGLYEPVETIINGMTQVNPKNYWGNLVYQFVKRYKRGSAFWSTVDADGGIDRVECWNEPGYWKTPNLDAGLYPNSYAPEGDPIELVEKLYARLCDVTMEAVHLADPNGGVKVLVGALGGVELEQVGTVTNPERLVKGKDWLRGYYQYRESTGTYGVTVHPYQYGKDRVAFMPSLFARDLDTIRAIMQANGEGDKPLWATELGYDQAEKDTMVTALSVPECYLAAMGGIEPRFYDRVMLYVLEAFEPPQDAPSALLGDATQGFTRRPSFYAYRQMTQELLGKRVNGRVLSGDSATDARTLVYELEDTATGERTWVGWRNYAPGTAAVAARIPARTDQLGIAHLARSAGADRLNRTMTAGSDGWLTLTLGTDPVYVHEIGPAMRPDLTVDSVWTEENPDSAVTLRARVKNMGNKQFVSSGRKGSVLRFAIDGVPVGPVAEPKRLAPAGIAYVESAPLSRDRSVMHLVSAVANPNKEVMELDFDNNARYCTLSAH
jgi:hypothetical protein